MLFDPERRKSDGTGFWDGEVDLTAGCSKASSARKRGQSLDEIPQKTGRSGLGPSPAADLCGATQ